MILNKRIKRSIKANLSFFITATLLTVITVAFLISALSTGNTLKNTVADFYKEYSCEDAEFTVYNIMDDDIDEIEKKYDVVIEKNSYKNIEAEDDSTLRVFKQTEKVNKYCIIDGSDIQSDGDVLITKRYAEEHNICIGDSIDIDNNSYKVCGYAIKSDYLYMLEKLTDSYRDNEKFGLVIMSDKSFEKIDENVTDYYGMIYNGDNEDSVRKYINNNYIISSYMSKNSDTRISLPFTQGRDVSNMAKEIAPIFFAIVIMIVALVISRMIKKEESVIGTLLALGYSKLKLSIFYCIYAVIPGIVGSVLGIVLGIVLTGPFSAFYIEGDFEPMPYTFEMNVPAFIISIFVPTLLYIIVSLFVSSIMLKKNVIDLIRKSSEKIKNIRIFINSNMRVKKKMQLRTLFGHLPKSLVIIFGVFTATALITIGLNAYNGFSSVVKNGISDNVKYNYMYVLNQFIDENNYGGEGILLNTYEVDNSTVQLSVVGIDENSEFFSYKTLDDKEMNYEDWYISSAAASSYSVSKGDTFTFKNINTLEKTKVKIAGIVEDNIHSYLYTSNKNASEVMGIDEGQYNVIVSSNELKIDDGMIASSTTVKMSQSQLETLLSSAMVGVYLLIIVGFILSIFILYLVINMTISEKKSSISLLKILGFNKKEISSMIINADFILVVLGFILGVPAGFLYSSNEYKGTVAKYGMSVDLTVNPMLIIFTFVVIFIAYLIVTEILKRKAFKTDMVISLKDFRNE